MTHTGWPALTMSEIRRGLEDGQAERHWSGTECWCGEVHDPEMAGLVPPPWAAEREGA